MSRVIVLVALVLASLSREAAAFPREVARTGVVNINTATDAELRELPGIGPAKSRRILDQRAKHRFEATDQLMKVKGIGRKTYRKLKPFLAVAGPTTIARKPRPPAREDATGSVAQKPVEPLTGS